MNVPDRLRELLYSLLVTAIIGSLWFVGWTQEKEDAVLRGTPPSPRWAALERVASVSGD